MKALFALLIILIAALLYWALNDQANSNPNQSEENELPPHTPPKAYPESKFQEQETTLSNPGTGRTRVIGKKKAQGLTATWHPEKKGIFVSPYNQEEIKAIGVVSGSKVKDSDGNEVVVPSFEDSPSKLYPISAPVPDRPGYVFNPYTQGEVDVRGIPPGTLVQDPKDPERQNHRFRTQ